MVGGQRVLCIAPSKGGVEKGSDVHGGIGMKTAR
jgi:hypothetical protein